MKKIRNATVSFIDAFHPNNETDIMAAEMARDCFERGYFGEAVERCGFLYRDGCEVKLCVFTDSDKAYLHRAELELSGYVTSDVECAVERVTEPEAELAQAETSLCERLMQSLSADFDAAYFDAVCARAFQPLLDGEAIEVVRRLEEPLTEDAVYRTLSCGAVLQRDCGSKMVVENGCLSDFVRTVEKELAAGARLLTIHFEALPLSNCSVAQAHSEARKALLSRSEHYGTSSGKVHFVTAAGLSKAASRRLRVLVREES